MHWVIFLRIPLYAADAAGAPEYEWISWLVSLTAPFFSERISEANSVLAPLPSTSATPVRPHSHGASGVPVSELVTAKVRIVSPRTPSVAASFLVSMAS